MEEGRRLVGDELAEDVVREADGVLAAAESAARIALDRAGGAVMFLTDRSCQNEVASNTLARLNDSVLGLRCVVGDLYVARLRRETARMELEEDVAQENTRVGGPGQPVQPGGDGEGDGGPGGGNPIVIGPGSTPPGCTRCYNLGTDRFEWRNAAGRVLAVESGGPRACGGEEAQGPKPGRQTWLG